MSRQSQQNIEVLIAGKDVEYIKKVRKLLGKSKVHLVMVYSVKRFLLEIRKKAFSIILLDYHSFSRDSISLIQEMNKVRFQGQLLKNKQFLMLLLDFEDIWILQHAMRLHLDGIVLKNQNMNFLNIQIHLLLKSLEQSDLSTGSYLVKSGKKRISSDKNHNLNSGVQRRNIGVPLSAQKHIDYLNELESKLKSMKNLLPPESSGSDTLKPLHEIARINSSSVRIVGELITDFHLRVDGKKSDKKSPLIIK